MTDKVVEGAPAETEPTLPAVEEVSQSEPEVQQPSVPEAGITETRLQEAIGKQIEVALAGIEDRLERMAQSAKDRGISKNAQEIAELRQAVETLGGGDEAWMTLQAQADQQALLTKITDLETRISQGPAPAGQRSAQDEWREEWARDSQKILDAAARLGVELTSDEYNAAMFNNGVAFKTKGDALAALQAATLAKAKGESISAAAVVTEGGKVTRPPEPPKEEAPKSPRQQYDEAKKAGDEATMRQALDAQWEEISEFQMKETAVQALVDSGMNEDEARAKVFGEPEKPID